MTKRIKIDDLRSRKWFMNPDNLEMTALYLERYLNYGLTREELRSLLEPWLGTGNVGEDLPLPAMIDARAGEAVDLDSLSARLSAGVEGARLDDHAGWLAPVSRVAGALAAVALIAAALVAAATAAIVVLGVRAGLGRHRETIDVLHLMGAEDRHISALFQYRFAMIGYWVGLAAAQRGPSLGLCLPAEQSRAGHMARPVSNVRRVLLAVVCLDLPAADGFAHRLPGATKQVALAVAAGRTASCTHAPD